MSMRSALRYGIVVLVVVLACAALDLLADGGPPDGFDPSAAGDGIPAGPGVQNAEALAEDLRGLDFETFLERSWYELTLRDPETIVALGLSSAYGLDEPTLTDISEAYVRETYRMFAVALQALRGYDRAGLAGDQQISYDVYEWYLDDILRGEEFLHCDYPATFLSVISVQEQVLHFFTELHPLRTENDARDYVTRLGLVGAKFGQLIDALGWREEAGVVPPAFAVDWALYGVRDLASRAPTDTPYYETLETKLAAVPGVSDATRRALLRAAEEAVRDSVLPGYRALRTQLEHQLEVAPTTDGVWQFPQGEAYYAHLLRHHTTTDLGPDKIHALGLAELDRIHAEMRAIFAELGYPADETLVELYDRVARDGGTASAGTMIETYGRLLDEAEARLGTAFSRLPRADVIVRSGPMSGVYESPAADGSRPGVFWAGSGYGEAALFAMPTLTYHETVPGHHLQIALAMETPLPTFRQWMSFLGYVEGWALYAERLASELGWYDDDPYGDLGRLQAEAWRAARLVVDTGIHAKRWTRSRAERFFTDNTGIAANDSANPQAEIARYVVWPGQATAYKVGMMRLLEMRQAAMDELGQTFDLKEFHEVVLGNGSLPLDILERVVADWIAEKKGP